MDAIGYRSRVLSLVADVGGRLWDSRVVMVCGGGGGR